MKPYHTPKEHPLGYWLTAQIADGRQFKILINAERIPSKLGPTGVKLRELFKFELEEIATVIKTRGEADAWNTLHAYTITEIDIDNDNPVSIIEGEPSGKLVFPFTGRTIIERTDGSKEAFCVPMFSNDAETLNATADKVRRDKMKVTDDFDFLDVVKVDIFAFPEPYEIVITTVTADEAKSFRDGMRDSYNELKACADWLWSLRGRVLTDSELAYVSKHGNLDGFVEPLTPEPGERPSWAI